MPLPFYRGDLWSLPKDPIEPVLENTARIAQIAFPKGNIYYEGAR